ncbi:MAG TPA: glycosyl transferase [Cyanobacteria bacterium UBA11149]|nr:glycosyl transferase [Cyanobacteria bacterium UBA11367]HBE57764.1 glycosyl transferase [Cyanobacteria bacterium UBA11366]HBK62978.1 glycosyl transferase [Cyanobacteria bacterium UBA11166]HBR77265.1 glycosyl transferase [Cyanobacteria bacterium UBA11159]HBS69377.1 glycosyl transferase [Cyanobacteria bacterium UBA11153]HBW90102.1 glycosyl transferase [Cyanobacteria bacterium UBA11149]HCA94972.1 glycosyl transferase [Cyanobacteria bacterium UBA9226]
MLVDFTVAIRTYNGEKHISEILEKLRSQINTDNISWEIVIVDNNSTDNTAKIIQEYQANWHQSYPLKYYLETKQGASFARKRSIQEARGTLIGFLDDDNLPESNWVAAAYAFGKSHPQAGAYGGQIKPNFEAKPPENFRDIEVFLAIIDRGQTAFCYNQHKQGVLPPGAGLVIRKEAWLESVPDRLLLAGPQGKSLSAKGEDMEILSHIQNAGWEIWYSPELCIYHQIPSWRMERNYLISLVGKSGLTRHHIRMIRLKPWQRPFAFFLYLANDSRQVILHWIKYFTVLNKDTVAACQMALLFSILISPFYTLRIHLSRKLSASN